METIDELVNELNKNTNYEEILVEIINIKENNTIEKVLEGISQNKHLNKKQKEKIYNSIFDYSMQLNQNFENKIEQIYKIGFRNALKFILDKINEQ